MNPELQALLVVQEDDDVVRRIEARRDAIAPRLVALDKARQKASDDVGRSEVTLTRELEKLRALQGRIAEHRDRLEKNLAVLDHAAKLKEATAAAAQVESARKVLADDESELLVTTRRITDLRTAGAAFQEVLELVTEEQATARIDLTAEMGVIQAEWVAARAKREVSAQAVGRSLLGKYDKVASRRRGPALFALHMGYSCGSCDTAIPLQRRPAMSSGTVIDVCEDCGVLVYFVPLPAPSAPESTLA